MSPVISNHALFADIMAGMGWTDIDTALAACKEHSLFSEEFCDNALNTALKSALRMLFRSNSIKDASGNPIKFASIKQKGTDGKYMRVYKQESLFDVGDFVQVVGYWEGRVKKAKERSKYYRNLGIERHGPQIQGFFDFPES